MECRIINSVRELNVYRRAFDVAIQIFHLTKGFPREEKYSLTDQILRSSRSVCAIWLRLGEKESIKPFSSIN